MSFIKKIIENKKKNNFNDWLDKNIEPNTANKDVVYEMLGEIKSMLKINGYKIQNEKQFKNELATYIYNDSN
jgi:hypothetical protein